MNETAIKIENVSKVYKLYDKPIDRLKESLSISKRVYHKQHYALQGISFELKKGETVAIIGLNGAGKSTLLKIITGVLNQTSGDLQINGNIAALLELGAGFNPEYTGIENIYLNGTMMGYSKEEMDKKINYISEFADIGEFIYQPVKTYSSGMFARLAFAVAVNVEPEILIVDEALSVGDIFFQQKCNQYMKEKMQNATKIIVTHDMNTVSNMAERVILLEAGSVIYDGNVQKGIEYYLKKAHNEIFQKKYDKDLVIVSENQSYDSMIEIDRDMLGGAKDVIITHFDYFINGIKSEVVKSKDNLNISFTIKSSKVIPDIIFGYSFKDKYGNVIFGNNTIGQGINIKQNIERGISYIVNMDIVWPEVRDDEYFLTLGIGEGSDEMIHNIQCWAHNILHLKSIVDKPMHGIINNNIQSISISKVGR